MFLIFRTDRLLYVNSSTRPSDEDNGTNDTFAASWNGTSWTLQSTVNPDPNDFQFEQFNAVSCSSPTFCVGWASGNAGNPGDTMIEQWNGSSWSLQTAHLGGRRRVLYVYE